MLVFPLFMSAQQPLLSAPAVVPRLVNFSGTAVNAQGKPLSGITGITFSIYKGQYDGAPLWMETQNVQADTRGNYSTQLGATKSDGLPVELFASGEARWLGVRVNGGEEQPRVMLLSVPYALKAGDAATIGGLPHQRSCWRQRRAVLGLLLAEMRRVQTLGRVRLRLRRP